MSKIERYRAQNTENLSTDNERTNRQRESCFLYYWVSMVILLGGIIVLVILSFVFPECSIPLRKCSTINGTVWFTGVDF